MLATKNADDGTVVVELPKTTAFDLYNVWIANGAATSPQIALNAPHPMHFDNAEIASGAHFRIFGRNLYVNAKAPTVTLIDAQTNDAIESDRRASNEQRLLSRCRRAVRRRRRTRLSGQCLEWLCGGAYGCDDPRTRAGNRSLRDRTALGL